MHWREEMLQPLMPSTQGRVCDELSRTSSGCLRQRPGILGDGLLLNWTNKGSTFRMVREGSATVAGPLGWRSSLAVPGKHILAK